MYQLYSILSINRKNNNNISVVNLSDACKRPIPHPVATFKQAFYHYR